MEHILTNLKSFTVFTVVLSILVIVHEWGHFITAKKLGVRVDKFSLGFGPKLYSKIHDGTEFLICLIPLGGYVKMAGDERAECKGSPDEFFSKPPGHRALIVLNGPVVNFILAYLCLVYVFFMGYPELSNKIGQLMDKYPAKEAGLLVGDKIIRIDNMEIKNWSDLQIAISSSQASQIEIEILRGKERLTKVIVPKAEERKNVFGQYKKTRLMGIIPSEDIVSAKYGFGTSLIKAGQKIWEITILTYKSLFFMLTGSMSAKESVTGPVGIFFIIKSAAEMGLTHVVFILGVISASLALFNLLPMIPLDGGHLLLLGIEKIRGQALPTKVDDGIARVGFTLIIALAIFVFYSDFSRLGWIDKIKNLFF